MGISRLGKSLCTDKKSVTYCKGEAPEAIEQPETASVVRAVREEVSVTVPLTAGYHALVDLVDLPLIQPYRWRIKRCASGLLYAHGYRKGIDDPLDTSFMHRVILGATRGQMVDHVNGDGLDNRRCNLRFCTHAQNSANRKISKNNTSGYNGVYFSKSRRKWRAAIRIDGQTRAIGAYDTAEEAARAFDIAAFAYRGGFARLNFPDEAQSAQQYAKQGVIKVNIPVRYPENSIEARIAEIRKLQDLVKRSSAPRALALARAKYRDACEEHMNALLEFIGFEPVHDKEAAHAD